MDQSDKLMKKLDQIIDSIISTRNLLILQLYNTNTPIREIVKATGISSADIYKIITKKKKKSGQDKMQGEE